MWFKNLRLFRLSPEWAGNAEMLEQALTPQVFRAGGSQDMQTSGWVPPHENSGLVHALDGQYLFCLRTEKKLLPNTVINQFARAKAQELEEQQGFKPGRKQIKEIKEALTQELLPKAFSLYKDTYVWLDSRHRWLVIDAAAVAAADEILGLLSKVLSPFPFVPLFVELSPTTAMTRWLADDQAPHGFSIGQDTELRSTRDSGAAIRYVRHSIDSNEVKKHIADGKQCTRLALTWADRISFVLTDNLEIKRLVPEDILKESQDGTTTNDAERFDADFALMSGEIAHLLDDLIAALGGEKTA